MLGGSLYRLGGNLNCTHCNNEIPEERLEAIPHTTKCIKCAERYPDPYWHDPNEVCAKSSPSGQNGWSPRD